MDIPSDRFFMMRRNRFILLGDLRRKSHSSGLTTDEGSGRGVFAVIKTGGREEAQEFAWETRKKRGAANAIEGNMGAMRTK